jgi:hypothetical protein
VAATVAAATLLTIVAPARASDLGDERARLERVRAQRAAAAARLDVLEATEDQTKDALDALDADVAGQEVLYANAKRSAEELGFAAAQARTEQVKKEAEIDRLARDARSAALQAYVDPPDDLGAALSISVATDAVVRRTVAGVVSRQATSLLDDYQAARDDLSYLRAQADRKAEQAAAAEEAANARLQTLQASLARQRQVVADIEDQLDAALVEAQSLAALDANLSASYARQQAELAARLSAAQALSSRAGGGFGDLALGSGLDLAEAAVVSVAGIRVARAIAGSVTDLVQDAARSGLVLSGQGYRSPAGQVAVRRANCGSSRYAIYSMPPSRCRPPAARPGKSMHERGLAIDFTCNGALITSRSSGCFRWLKANAWKYGLKNYPREPWHWSTNGR